MALVGGVYWPMGVCAFLEQLTTPYRPGSKQLPLLLLSLLSSTVLFERFLSVFCYILLESLSGSLCCNLLS